MPWSGPARARSGSCRRQVSGCCRSLRGARRRSGARFRVLASVVWRARSTSRRGQQPGNVGMPGWHVGDDRLPGDGPAGERFVGAVGCGHLKAEPAGAVQHNARVRVCLPALGVPCGQQRFTVVLGLGRDGGVAVVGPVRCPRLGFSGLSVASFDGGARRPGSAATSRLDAGRRGAGQHRRGCRRRGLRCPIRGAALG